MMGDEMMCVCPGNLESRGEYPSLWGGQTVEKVIF